MLWVSLVKLEKVSLAWTPDDSDELICRLLERTACAGAASSPLVHPPVERTFCDRHPSSCLVMSWYDPQLSGNEYLLLYLSV